MFFLQEKRYSCDKCDKQFCTGTEMKRHKLSHQTAKPFQCEYPDCDYAAKTKRHLQYHEETHEAKTEPCPICGILFHTANRLRNHMYRHKKFVWCNIGGCRRSFKTQEALDAHASEQHRLDLVRGDKHY